MTYEKWADNHGIASITINDFSFVYLSPRGKIRLAMDGVAVLHGCVFEQGKGRFFQEAIGGIAVNALLG